MSATQIRRKLRCRAPLIKHLAAVATDFVEGADPADALYFLRLLRIRCDEAIRAVNGVRP